MFATLSPADVMALRCKSGAGGANPEAGEVLNFPRSDYETLLPIIDRLSRVGGRLDSWVAGRAGRRFYKRIAAWHRL